MINNNSRTRNASKGIAWGFLYRLFSIVLPFVTRTIMIYYLGIEYTGLGSLFTSILQVLSLAELGIGHALVFGMYKPVAEENYLKVNAYLNFCKKCYKVIGGVILVVGLLLLPFLPKLVSGNVPVDVNLYVLYLIYLFNTVISYFLYAYKTCVLTATQHTDIINQIQLVCLFGSQLFSAIFLLLFKNYYLYSICIPASTVANNLLVNRIVVSKFPEIQSEGQLEHDEIADIKEIVFGMVFQKIGSVVLSSVDSIVISAFLGLTILGKYNNYYYIITALFGFMNVIVTSLVPSVGNSIQTQNIETNYKLFRTFSFIYAWITIWCSACLLSLYQPFMKLWVGESNMLDFRIVVLLVIYFIVWKLVDPAYIFRDAAGSWKEYKCIPLIAAAVNLVSNIILVQYIGLQGIVISTIVAFGLIYIPFFSYPLFKTVFKTKSKYYTYIFDQVKYLLIAALVDTATFYVCKYILGETVTGLVLKAGICIIVPNVILFLAFFKTKDYQETMHFLQEKIRHKN